mmetsp:Transcript_115962/g.247835  ORF Transcript_115962/g.247835 Transcript_115962/m.247835 type:complete len:341 (+) Transcript_115962:69-1091(+)
MPAMEDESRGLRLPLLGSLFRWATHHQSPWEHNSAAAVRKQELETLVATDRRTRHQCVSAEVGAAQRARRSEVTVGSVWQVGPQRASSVGAWSMGGEAGVSWRQRGDASMVVNRGRVHSDPFAEEALPQEALLRDSVDLHLASSPLSHRGRSRAERRASRSGETSVSPEIRNPHRPRHASVATGSRRTRSKARPAASPPRQIPKAPTVSRSRPVVSPPHQGQIDRNARFAASPLRQVVEASAGRRTRSAAALSPQLVEAAGPQSAPHLPHVPDETDAEPNPSELREQCVVCFDRDVGACMIPCGHVATCMECAKKLSPQRCPFCRVPIVEVVPTKGRRRR